MGEFIVISSKIPKDVHTQLLHYCEKEGVSSSKLIRDLVEENISSVVPLNKAGLNRFVYDKKTDSFSWTIEYDDGSVNVVSDRISPDFIRNLRQELDSVLSSRDGYLKRKKPESVPVPSRMKKLKVIRNARK